MEIKVQECGSRRFRISNHRFEAVKAVLSRDENYCLAEQELCFYKARTMLLLDFVKVFETQKLQSFDL